MSCIGLYCGRIVLGNGSLSDCGACPSGSRVNGSGICEECKNMLSNYDWFYLLFMALLALVLNYFFIDVTSRNRNCQNMALHISATVETILSFIVTILVFEPVGSFDVRSCESKRISDWYTILYNPSPDFINTIHCTQQAVYPLYSMVFLMYLLSLTTMLIIRATISKLIPKLCCSCRGDRRRCRSHGSGCCSCCRCCNNGCCGSKRCRGNGGFGGFSFCSCSLYSALFFYPVITCLHAVFAGVIYYSYPYLIVIGSIITNAIHFSSYRVQSPSGLLQSLFTKPWNMVILMAHWLVHAFGIISLLSSNISSKELSYLCLIPLPSLVYICSVYFTDPEYLDVDNIVWDKEGLPGVNSSSNFIVSRDRSNSVLGAGVSSAVVASAAATVGGSSSNGGGGGSVGEGGVDASGENGDGSCGEVGGGGSGGGGSGKDDGIEVVDVVVNVSDD